MLPVVLIHGYSTEGATDGLTVSNRAQIVPLYDRLPADLAAMTDAAGNPINVVPINLSRWLSLDDGITIEDVSYALQRALVTDYPNLIATGFNAIIHSTGALVARNWVRRHTTPGNCPLKGLIHLAGANFGSGWATVGQTLLAKFLRVAQGTSQGIASLQTLELGGSWALDLHTHFLIPGNEMLTDYGVVEFCLIGSQPAPEYFLIPISYGTESGADGVVRVSSCNLNFNYVKIGPTAAAKGATWLQAQAAGNGLYELRLFSSPGNVPTGSEAIPGAPARSLIPFAIPYDTCHSDQAKETAIEFGSDNRQYVLPLIQEALSATPATYAGLAATFDAATASTYNLVAQPAHSTNFFSKPIFAGIVNAISSLVDHNPQGQYDKHAQLIFRVTDQFGQPVNDFSIYFNSLDPPSPNQLIDELFVDKHKNNLTPNTICFYLRVAGWNQADNAQLLATNGVTLEIDAVDPVTQRAVYIPIRFPITAADLGAWIQPHRTTVVDVILQRVPTDNTFTIA